MTKGKGLVAVGYDRNQMVNELISIAHASVPLHKGESVVAKKFEAERNVLRAEILKRDATINLRDDQIATQNDQISAQAFYVTDRDRSYEKLIIDFHKGRMGKRGAEDEIVGAADDAVLDVDESEGGDVAKASKNAYDLKDLKDIILKIKAQLDEDFGLDWPLPYRFKRG
ncbi:uncharacterized protein AB675_2424 [Cyphellophora attinorum]|uniref:Uncharacterized protein n=1 Tax=Cyphellophora attinorum TaxID=1664694 RepID=A0A0N1P377_9EURO|nr:uncharacterized protein AB675_2424 [Phialophora attinorum]KPI44954.1 hypothetical protein AB675_2424 [Phialophora attinorum]